MFYQLNRIAVWILCRLFEIATRGPSWVIYLTDWVVYLKKKIVGIPHIRESDCINREWLEEYNLPHAWWYAPKKRGISGVCRVKNGDDFLCQTIESHLELCDEIIIVDNNSEDRTFQIAQELAKKYPDKIRVYNYPHNVYKLGTPEAIHCPSNSIHAFAYQSNWSLSKASYSHVIKVDDDHILLPERARALRQFVMESNPQRFIYLYGLNIVALHRDEYAIPLNNPYSGRYGDFWLFPISSQVFFYQFGGCEPMHHPWRYFRFGELYLHLKFLKKEFGFTNLPPEKKSNYITHLASSEVSKDFAWLFANMNTDLLMSIMKKLHITPKAYIKE